MASHISFFPDDIVTSSKVLDDEIHEDRDCKCERRCLHYDNYRYYIFYRNCVCGKYNSEFVPPDLSDLPVGHINKEGIDIHGHASCTYEYVYLWTGKKKFVLRCYCDKLSSRNTIR